MTPAQFTRAEIAAAVAAAGMDAEAPSTEAAMLVLTGKMTGYRAARLHKLTQGAVNAKKRKLLALLPRAQPCTHCHGTGREPE